MGGLAGSGGCGGNRELAVLAGEVRVLRIAASIGGGVRVDLSEFVTSLDERNGVVVARAVLAAGGHHVAADGRAG